MGADPCNPPSSRRRTWVRLLEKREYAVTPIGLLERDDAEGEECEGGGHSPLIPTI